MKNIVRKSIKKEAKNKPKKTLALSLLIVMIIAILIITATYFIIDLTGYSYNIKIINDIIIGIILTLISPFILGFSKIALDICQNKKTNYKEVFKSIKEIKFIKIFGILILSFIFIVWILGLIPGVGFFINLVILILYTPLFIMMPFVYLQNQKLSVKEIVFKTSNIISEHRIIIYGLLISFIFWIILSLLTFGLLFFYVIPYIYLSISCLYLNLIHEKEYKKQKAISDGNIILIFITISILLIGIIAIKVPGATNVFTAIINGQINTKIGDTTLSYGGIKITYDAPKEYEITSTTDTSNTYIKNNNILQYSIYLSKKNKILEMDKEIVSEMKSSGKKVREKESNIKVKGQKLICYEYTVTEGNDTNNTITVYYPKGDFTVAISLTNNDREISKNDIKEFITIY